MTFVTAIIKTARPVHFIRPESGREAEGDTRKSGCHESYPAEWVSASRAFKLQMITFRPSIFLRL